MAPVPAKTAATDATTAVTGHCLRVDNEPDGYPNAHQGSRNVVQPFETLFILIPANLLQQASDANLMRLSG